MIPLRLLQRSSPSFRTMCVSTPVRWLQLSAVCERPKSKKPAAGDSQNVDNDVDQDLKDAAVKVAASLPGDADKTASDLLKQLRAHAASNADNKQDTAQSIPSLGDLFSGMKVESADGTLKGPDSRMSPYKRHTHRAPHERNRNMPRSLFGSPPLGIFAKRSDAEVTIVSTVGEESLWDRVDREELEKLTRTPPTNAFEEMIHWTNEGKLWHFPINNEQGMDEEGKYEFTDHIFFDEQLEDFPKKGPIRHFMELVTIGLSKNPYLTVLQKHEHIAWFKTYFDEKQQILDDVIRDSTQK